MICNAGKRIDELKNNFLLWQKCHNCYGLMTLLFFNFNGTTMWTILLD